MGKGKRKRKTKKKKKRKTSRYSSSSSASFGDSESFSNSDTFTSDTDDHSDSESDSNKKRKSKEKKEKRMRGSRIVMSILSFPFNFYQGALLIRTAFRRDIQGIKSYALFRLFDAWYFDFFNIRTDYASEFLLKELGFLNILGYLTYIIFWLFLVFSNLQMQTYKDGDSEIERRVTKTAFIDDIISSVSAKQIVILGAELDTRAYNEELVGRKIDTIYEVGNKEMLKRKRKILKNNDFDVSKVIYVDADLEENWGKNLSKHGFDPARATIFVCEDLSYFYDEDFAEDLLGLMSDYMEQNASSVLVFDYYDKVKINLFMRLFQKRLNRFEVPGKSKYSGRKNLARWLERHSLYIHDQVRMEKLAYGVALVSILESYDNDYSSESSRDSSDSDASSE